MKKIAMRNSEIMTLEEAFAQLLKTVRLETYPLNLRKPTQCILTFFLNSLKAVPLEGAGI